LTVLHRAATNATQYGNTAGSGKQYLAAYNPAQVHAITKKLNDFLPNYQQDRDDIVSQTNICICLSVVVHFFKKSSHYWF
jgi:hypothetical protein